MGRRYTGAITVNECAKMDIRHLVRYGFIANGKAISGVMQWEKGGCISYYSDLTGKEKYINVVYSVTKKSGENKSYDYKILIEALPSNLGAGEVLFLICPVSGQRCRVLYSAYNSDIWQGRDTFNKRLYYSTQISSKRWVYNSRYFTVVDQVNHLKSKRDTTTHKGVKTKRAALLDKAQTKQQFLDYKRTIALAAGLPKSSPYYIAA